MFDPKFIQNQIRKEKIRLSEFNSLKDFDGVSKTLQKIGILKRRLHSNLVGYHRELKSREMIESERKKIKQDMQDWYLSLCKYDNKLNPSDIRDYVLIPQHASDEICSEFTSIDDCKDMFIKGYLQKCDNNFSILKGYRCYSVANNGMLTLVDENLDSSD